MDSAIPNIVFNSTLDITNARVLGYGISLGIALYLAQRWMDGNKQSIPLVPYKYPILGSTLEWNSNPVKFIKDATEKYGPVFRIYVNGRVQTVVGRDLVRNVAANESFNFLEAFQDTFDLDYMLRQGQPAALDLHAMIAKHITPNLKAYTPRVVRKLNEAMDSWLGGVEDSITVENPYAMIQDMVSNASTSVFVGEELCKNEEFVHTAKIFTFDIGRAISGIGLMGLIPGVSRLYQRFMFKFMNPTSRHIEVIIKVINPEVERRMKEAREQGDSWNRPQDILQDMVDQFPSDTPAPTVARTISADMLSLIFASIHTTTLHSILVLYVLADYGEYVQELLDEQDAVLAEEEAEGEAEELGTPYGFSTRVIKKMAKLDSLLREVFRLTEGAATLPHKNVTKSEYTLPDGTKVPKGEYVLLNTQSLMFDEELQGPDPENFNPWRFVNKNKQASKVGVDYLRFGMGKHACPGRFFAIQEIKTILSILIRKYRVVRPVASESRSIEINPQGPLMFIKRE